MKTFNSVAGMKQARLQSGQIVETKSYYNNSASDVSGSAKYRIMTLGEFGGTPDEFGDHTLANGNVAKIYSDDEYIDVLTYGVKSDGTDQANNTSAIAAIIAKKPRLRFPVGNYAANDITYSGNIVAQLDNGVVLQFKFLRPTQESNRFTINNELPSLGQLGPQNNPAEQQNNALLAVRGTTTDPDVNTKYSETTIYAEMHTSAVINDPQSVWGSPWKISTVTAENQAHENTEAEVCGASFRSYSVDSPVNTTKRNLVGCAAIGQTNCGVGNENWGAWGGNFIAAETTGNNAPNCVGIEVDLIHINSADFTTKPGTGNNYTGYWAQSDARDGAYSHTAFLATRTAESAGWANIVRYDGPCFGPMLELTNTRNDPNARGLNIQTAFGGATGFLINADITTNDMARVNDTAFRVTGEIDDPVYVKAGSLLRQVLVGPADSGGAGFRALRVTNTP